MSEHLSAEVLLRLCGVAGDGPYQATGFAAQVGESIGIQHDDEDLAMPVTWDTTVVIDRHFGIKITHCSRDRTCCSRDRTHCSRDRTHCSRNRTHCSRDRGSDDTGSDVTTLMTQPEMTSHWK